MIGCELNSLDESVLASWFMLHTWKNAHDKADGELDKELLYLTETEIVLKSIH